MIYLCRQKLGGVEMAKVKRLKMHIWLVPRFVSRPTRVFSAVKRSRLGRRAVHAFGEKQACKCPPNASGVDGQNIPDRLFALEGASRFLQNIFTQTR